MTVYECTTSCYERDMEVYESMEALQWPNCILAGILDCELTVTSCVSSETQRLSRTRLRPAATPKSRAVVVVPLSTPL